MPYSPFELPEFPCKSDLWDRLASEDKPIIVYGMGNGADKLIHRLGEYGVEISDFFASDGFVRGHSFHGKRVKSFSEIKEEYTDFVILLSFATNRDEVLDQLMTINNSYEMYIPDMPVAFENEYFDRDFYNCHYSEIITAYNSLSDEYSRNCFAAIVNYKLTGEMKYLLSAYSDKSDIYGLLLQKNVRVAVDAGAYNGDTIREMKNYFSDIKTVYALEPDTRNFKKLCRYREAENGIVVIPINVAAWSEDRTGSFSVSGNRNSSVSSTVSFEHKLVDVDLIRIDTAVNDNVDFIKYDVEGAEYAALLGSDVTISRCRPSLLISLYHKSRDLFELINYMQKYSDYSFYLRRVMCVPAWELDLIMIPKM